MRRIKNKPVPPKPRPAVAMDFLTPVNSSGSIGTVQGTDRIRSLITQILLTSSGERIMEPEFGCGLFDLLFEPLGDITRATCQFEVRQALVRWLGEVIEVEEVDIFDVLNEDSSALEVSITYTLIERPEETQSLRLRLKRP